jgi:hypothetical protein
MGEPTTTTLLTRSGYWMATDRLTVPPMLCPTRGACNAQLLHELVYQAYKILHRIGFAFFARFAKPPKSRA